jgi:hypothetical protein
VQLRHPTLDDLSASPTLAGVEVVVMPVIWWVRPLRDADRTARLAVGAFVTLPDADGIDRHLTGETWRGGDVANARKATFRSRVASLERPLGVVVLTRHDRPG